jgi:DNA-binding PadR family transcriptional regulator
MEVVTVPAKHTGEALTVPEEAPYSRRDSRLPLTTYATLGLLSTVTPFSAVEIEERARLYLRHFYWTPALSHIRRELDRLEKLGYVECREVISGRIKRTLKYRPTPEGTAALKEWVESGHIERTVKKDPAILRLWLVRRGADPAVVLDAFDHHLEYVRSERDSVISHVAETEALCKELADVSKRMDNVDGGGSDAEDLNGARWRMEWHLEVMRYCLRDYDNELENLEQLQSGMRRLLIEMDGAQGGRFLAPQRSRSAVKASKDQQPD